MDSNILKKIKALPPLDDTIMKIQRICTDKNSSLNALVKDVEGDPMLTANILKSSNQTIDILSEQSRFRDYLIGLLLIKSCYCSLQIHNLADENF